MPTEEEIREFMRKYYPEWANNLELGRILYEKFIKRNRNNSQIGAEVAKIGDILSGQYNIGAKVLVKGIVMDISVRSYLGCPICYRKVERQCEHIVNKQTKPEELKIYMLRVRDDTGEILVSTFPKNVKEQAEFESAVSVGDVISVVGEVNLWRDIWELRVRQFNVKRKVKIDMRDDPKVREILTILEKMGKVKEPIFVQMCRSRGVDIDLVREYIEIRDGFVYVRGGEE